MIDPSVSIHRQACIDATGIDVGPRSRIWQFASVIRGAKIGADCNIGSCAIIDGAMIGDQVAIGAGAKLFPGIVIKDRVFIGPGAVFCNDLWPSVSKDGFDLGQLQRGDLVTTVVEEGASIGAAATILPGVVIGTGAMIAAGAVVDHSVPADHLFRRDGVVVPIDERRGRRRMVRAAMIDLAAAS